MNEKVSKSDIIEILKQNQEFKALLTEQQHEIQDLHKHIIDTVKHTGNTVNQTINNNQKFNLNFFLNEQCKDAINMSLCLIGNSLAIINAFIYLLIH